MNALCRSRSLSVRSLRRGPAIRRVKGEGRADRSSVALHSSVGSGSTGAEGCHRRTVRAPRDEHVGVGGIQDVTRRQFQRLILHLSLPQVPFPAGPHTHSSRWHITFRPTGGFVVNVMMLMLCTALGQWSPEGLGRRDEHGDTQRTSTLLGSGLARNVPLGRYGCSS